MATNSIDIGVALHGFGLADEAFGVLSNSLNQVGEQAKNAQNAFAKWKTDKTEQNLKDLGDATKSVKSAMGDFATTGLTLLGTKLTALSRTLIGAGAELQQMRIALKTLSVEGENTADTLEKIKEVAKLPGLDFKQALRGITVLRASGIEATLATNAVRELGNALASVGGDPQELQGVIRAFSQIQSKGKIYAEEILQIAERLPQIRKIMLETFGTANTEILQAEGFTSEEFIEAITRGLSKLTRVEDNAVNAMQNFQNSVFQLKSAIGDQLLEQVQDLLEWVTNIILKISKWDEGTLKLTATIVSVTGVIATLTAGIIALYKAVGMLSAVGLVVKAEIGTKALGGLNIALRAVGVSAFILKGVLIGLGVGLVALVGYGLFKFLTKTKKEVDKVKKELETLTDHVENLQGNIKRLGERQKILDTLDEEISRHEAIEGFLDRASGLEKQRFKIMKEQSELKIQENIQKYNEKMITEGGKIRTQKDEETGKTIYQIQKMGTTHWETLKDIQKFKKSTTKEQLKVLEKDYEAMKTKFSDNAESIENEIGVYEKLQDEVKISFSDLFDNSLGEAENVLKYAKTILSAKEQVYDTKTGGKGKRTNKLEPIEEMRNKLYNTLFKGDVDFLSSFYEKGINYFEGKSKSGIDYDPHMFTKYDSGNPKDIQDKLVGLFLTDIEVTMKKTDTKAFLKSLGAGLRRRAMFSPQNLEQATKILSRIQDGRDELTEGQKSLSKTEHEGLKSFLDKWETHTVKVQTIYAKHASLQYAQQADDLKVMQQIQADIAFLSSEEPEDPLLLGLMSKNAVQRLKTLKIGIDDNENIQKAVFEYLKTGDITVGKELPETLQEVLNIIKKVEKGESFNKIISEGSYEDLEGLISSSWGLIVDGLIDQTTAFGAVISKGGKNVAKTLLYDKATGKIDLETNLKAFVDLIEDLSTIFPETLGGKTNIGVKITEQLNDDKLNALLNENLYQQAFGAKDADELRSLLGVAFSGQRPVALEQLKVATQDLNAFVERQVKYSTKILGDINDLIKGEEQTVFETYLKSLEIRKQQMSGLTLEFEGNVTKDILSLGEGLGIDLKNALNELSKSMSYGKGDKIKSIIGFEELLTRLDTTEFNALDPTKIKNFQQEIQKIINTHQIWGDLINEINNKYTRMNAEQSRERKKVLSESVFSLTGMYFEDDKLITPEQMESVRELEAIEQKITAEKNKQDNLVTQITKATSQMTASVNENILNDINETLEQSYSTTEISTKNTLKHIGELQQLLGGDPELLIELQKAFDGTKLNAETVQKWNDSLGSVEEVTKRLKVLGYLISLDQKTRAEDQRRQSIAMVDILELAKKLSGITKEQKNTQKEELRIIRERIKLLERNNTLIEKMADITNNIEKKYRFQQQFYINRNKIIHEQISLAEEEKKQLEDILKLTKEQLETKIKTKNFLPGEKQTIEALLKAMDLAGVKNIENLKNQETGYNEIIDRITELRSSLRMTNFEMIQAVNAITDERISKYFDSLTADLNTVNMIIEDTADIAENAKLGIQFLGVGIGELVSSDMMDTINKGVLGELKDTSKMTQVLKKREAVRRDYVKRENVYTEQLKEINKVLKQLGDVDSLERELEISRQTNINEQKYQLNQERIQKEAQFNKELREIYNENIKRNNDKIQNELDYQKTVSDLQEKDEMQQFEAGWKGSQKRKGQAYQDAKKEASLRAQNKGLDRMYKIQTQQFKLKRDEEGMTGDENIWDLGLTNEQAKILQDEQIFLTEHEQSKTALQQEADLHNMKLDDKRRSGNIAFEQKYQNSITESWRKHKSDLFSIEQEYQAKMRGMYDSEGKTLMDKKEEHDKLQTEESLKRRKVNQTYLAEQTNLYAQLERDKKSAEQKKQRGRSIDPFAPDPEEVKDSMEQIERDRRRIMNKTFTLQHYQQGKVMDEEQTELLAHLEEQFQIQKFEKQKWNEFDDKKFDDRRTAIFTNDMGKMMGELQKKRMLKDLLDPTTEIGGGGGHRPTKQDSHWDRSKVWDLSSWEQMFTQVLSEQFDVDFTDKNQAEAIENMLGKFVDTEERKAEYIWNLATGGVKSLRNMALGETGGGAVIPGGERTTGTLFTVEQAIENGTKSIVGALNLLGGKLIGDEWVDAQVYSINNNSTGKTLNGIVSKNDAGAKLNDTTSNGNAGGAGGEIIGLVKIEVNGDELPVFGKLSVDAINANSVSGGFTRIFKEAIAPEFRNNTHTRNIA